MIATTLENKIMQGDCKEIMRQIEPNCIDCCVTDPPYGYSFMGKDWDKAVPSVAIWKECLRVLKPGAFAFVMSSPRADVLSHMIVNLSDAGFRTDFTPIYWAYASGFPKAMNIGKAVDKRLGVKPIIIGKKQGDRYKYDFKNSSGHFVDTRNVSNNLRRNDVGLETKPTSEEAKLLDGSFGGFQPKPAVEVIIVAMKPLSEKTYVDQALSNQKGVTWLDDCRVPYESESDKALAIPGGKITSKVGAFAGRTQEGKDSELDRAVWKDNMKGRFPANLLVSNDCLNDGVNHVSGHMDSIALGDETNQNVYGKMTPRAVFNPGDEGSFSRFFSLDAWFEKGFKKLPLEVQRTFPFIIEPKASKEERNRNLGKLDNGTYLDESRHDKTAIGCNNPRNRTGKIRKGNIHPTVKPLQLMSYLITLGSRPNDLVLDPFVGSGTTCLAAKMLGRRFLGIELNKEYFALAEARVGNHRTLFEFSTPEVCIRDKDE